MAWITVASEMQSDPTRRLALIWTHAIPNGFYRSPASRMKAKREGVKAGILDVCIPAPELSAGGVRSRKTNYHGLYIEMKRRGERLRTGQSSFMDYLDLVHYRNALSYTWQNAARLIVEHLALEDGTYPPIELEGEDDRELVIAMIQRAKEIDLIRNPKGVAAPPVKTKQRRARPRSSPK